jgi:hypothetical protein
VDQLGVFGGDQHRRRDPGELKGADQLPVEPHRLAPRRETHLYRAETTFVLELDADKTLALPQTHGLGDFAVGQLAGKAQIDCLEEVRLARRVAPNNRRHPAAKRYVGGVEVAVVELLQRAYKHPLVYRVVCVICCLK